MRARHPRRCRRDRPARGRVAHRGDAGAVGAAGDADAGIARAGGHRPRAHDPGADPGRERGRGQRGRPGAAVLRDRAPARRRHRDGRARRRRRPASKRAGSRRRCARCRRPSSRACPRPSEGGVRVEAAAFAEALRQVVPGASRDDARPILTGVLLTASAGGLRLVATDSYRLALRDLAGREHAGGGPEGPRGGEGPGRGAAAAVERDRRDRGRARRARGRVPRRHHRGHHPADRGRVPELPAADPERVPEPAHRGARRAAGGGQPRAPRRPEQATPRRSGWT